jgi:hypothetical protein
VGCQSKGLCTLGLTLRALTVIDNIVGSPLEVGKSAKVLAGHVGT